MQKLISLAEFGWFWLEQTGEYFHLVMKHGPGCALFLRRGLEPNIFPPGPPSQSKTHRINVNVVYSNFNQPAAKA